jgi:16S rRNA (cytidine1402-2'-O)-methyltransferase
MRLECLAREERTMVVYEAPHRLIETLSDLKTYLGEDRRLVIAREMTKVYEEFWRGTLEEAVSEWEVRKSKGEFTLVLEGKSQELIVNQVKDYQPFYQEVIKRKGEGEKSSSIIREVAEREGLSRSGLYQYYLNKTKKGD